jgi:LacI family transcriptional regulator, gluconate utilization system Gnt-I transcriptional repressor
MPRRRPPVSTAVPTPAKRGTGRRTGRTTLADVAQLAEVSPITVSRALRGERSVAPELVARVQAAAQRMGYVPDPAARALASRHSTHVAVLVPMLSNALFVDVIEAIQRTLRPAGYQTLIGITHYDPQEEEQLLREQLMHRPAGVLITGVDQAAATQALLAHSGVPAVHMMALDEARPSVGLSQAEAAVAMTRHLIERGHKRIAFAAAQLDPRTMQRRQGWRREMQRHGLHEAALEWLNPAPSSLALGGVLFEQIARQTPAVDAVFFCNDDLAQGALMAALRLKIAVPERIAVVGFNDLTGSDQMTPALTTVRTPRAAIGERAAQLLLALMRGQAPAEQCVDLGYEVIVRGSS